MPSCRGLDDVPFDRRSFAPVQETLNGVEMTPSLGVEDGTVLDLDAHLAAYLRFYNEERAYTGRLTNGRTPLETSIGARKMRPR